MNSTDCIAARLERMQHEFRDRVNASRHDRNDVSYRSADRQALRALHIAANVG